MAFSPCYRVNAAFLFDPCGLDWLQEEVTDGISKPILHD